MTDWNLNIKVLEDLILDLEKESAYDNDTFNFEISKLKELVERMKNELIYREYAYMANDYDVQN